jgi:hypothetical protein
MQIQNLTLDWIKLMFSPQEASGQSYFGFRGKVTVGHLGVGKRGRSSAV